MSEVQTKKCGNCKDIDKCFRKFFPNDIDFINSKKTHVSYLRGETLFKEGAFASSVLFVIEGLVKVFVTTSNNKQINLKISKPGDFIAFSSIFENSVYNYSAVAIKDAKICMVEKNAMKQLLTKNADFLSVVTAKNCRNESRYVNIIKSISYKQMRGKLASALLYLTDEEFKDYNVFEYLTRQDISNFASITSESTVRFLKEFENEGIVELNKRSIKLLNKSQLEKISISG